jgi:hypothetical protein
MPRIVFVSCLITLACGSPPLRVAMRAPNPSGCYVMLFEGTKFGANSDVLNGPGQWASLDGLTETNHTTWANRIRSVRVGGAARVTAFTGARFQGQSETYLPETDVPALDQALSANIESLSIQCLTEAAIVP